MPAPVVPAGFPAAPARVGIIANPVSARDVRRIVSHAAGLTITERVGMLLRLLHTLAACGVRDVMMMPEREGLRPQIECQLARTRGENAPHALPRLQWLDMPVRGNVEDTFEATRRLHDMGVGAIMVLGGDGTHRAVAAHCGNIPIVAISSGTNNVFPALREVTVTALATALFLQGRISPRVALRQNKLLRISKRHVITGKLAARDVALVDVGVFNERILGEKAIGQVDSLRTIFVTQASPESVGLSGVAAMLQPLDRHQPGALRVELSPEIGPHAPVNPTSPPRVLRAALAPGLIRDLKVISWAHFDAGVLEEITGQSGLLSFDGEREMHFGPEDRIQIEVREDAFLTLDVPACLHEAARKQLMLQP